MAILIIINKKISKILFINSRVRMSYDYWNFKYLKKPTNYIFGFGSTINQFSRNSTSIDISNSIPVRISKYFGYRRCWNFHCPTSKFTALGLEKTNSKSSSTINGIIYPVNSNITEFDKREEGYTRINIPINLIQSISWIKMFTVKLNSFYIM